MATRKWLKGREVWDVNKFSALKPVHKIKEWQLPSPSENYSFILISSHIETHLRVLSHESKRIKTIEIDWNELQEDERDINLHFIFRAEKQACLRTLSSHADRISTWETFIDSNSSCPRLCLFIVLLAIIFLDWIMSSAHKFTLNSFFSSRETWCMREGMRLKSGSYFSKNVIY